MFGLERDFIQQDGITMLLGRAEGLAAGELNMVQARMLMNTGIPHHLRLLLREIDMQVTLEYTVSRRKMLGALLKSERLSMMDFFRLLLQIAVGMEEGRLYMLRSEQYALHEDYIFIEGPLSSGKVFLTYLPLQNVEPAARPGEALKSLIMVFMAAIHELSGDGMRRLLQYCGEESFSPGGLKELLAELLTGADVRTESAEAAGQAKVKNWTGAVAAALADRADQDQQPTFSGPDLPKVILPERPAFAWDSGIKNAEPPDQVPDQAPWLSGTPRLRRKEAAAADQSEAALPERTARPEEGPSPYRTYMILGAVLGDALLWKFLYLADPQTLWLAVCAAATLGLALLGWMIWSGKIAAQKTEEETEEGEELIGRPNSARQLRNELEWDFGRNPVVPLRNAAPVSSRSGRSAISDDGAAVDRAGKYEAMAGLAGNRLQVQEPVAATALLEREPIPDRGAEVPKNSRAVPYLERTGPDDGGIPERIELSRPSFIIGRSAEVAQYIETSEGASRVHAEISRSSGGYILKDLDSRNGTLLAGEAMVPYKEYPLVEGTEFTIVKGCYTFHSA